MSKGGVPSVSRRGGTRPGAGRKPGQTIAKQIRDKASAMGCDPIEKLLEFANNEEETTKLRADCLKAILPYAYPRLAAIEVSRADSDLSAHSVPSAQLVQLVKDDE